MQRAHYCCPISIKNVIFQKILVELPNSDGEADGLTFASDFVNMPKIGKKNKCTQTFY